jgi:3-isopropylmalate/(R)-2-methylmalate dehydratase small subunit
MYGNTKIQKIEGTAIPVRGNDIDTDRIIPARYLLRVTFEGLGENAFQDERFDKHHNPKNHPFNDPRFKGGSFLLVNKNFGCGSSREHAPQSLLRFGIKAIIGESFAEIFAGNCTALGIPVVTCTAQDIERIMQFVEDMPDVMISLDLENKSVRYNDITILVDTVESSRRVLTEGKWDLTTQLLRNIDDIRAAADKIPYLNW